MGPVMYLLYICDIPQLEKNTINAFADITAIMAIENNNIESFEELQTTYQRGEELCTNKLNKTKSLQKRTNTNKYH